MFSHVVGVFVCCQQYQFAGAPFIFLGRYSYGKNLAVNDQCLPFNTYFLPICFRFCLLVCSRHTMSSHPQTLVCLAPVLVCAAWCCLCCSLYCIIAVLLCAAPLIKIPPGVWVQRYLESWGLIYNIYMIPLSLLTLESPGPWNTASIVLIVSNMDGKHKISK